MNIGESALFQLIYGLLENLFSKLELKKNAEPYS